MARYIILLIFLSGCITICECPKPVAPEKFIPCKGCVHEMIGEPAIGHIQDAKVSDPELHIYGNRFVADSTNRLIINDATLIFFHNPTDTLHISN